MHDLFADQIQDAYSAETQLTKALPKMAAAATNAELKAGFQQHLGQPARRPVPEVVEPAIEH